MDHFVPKGILRIFKMCLLYSIENNLSSIRFMNCEPALVIPVLTSRTKMNKKISI
jgi:hypothetical protein